MSETAALFEEIGVKTHRMIEFKRIVEQALEMGLIDAEQKKTIEEWLKTPWTWAARRGLIATTREN
mgnify:CR=1 FL=1